MRKPTAKQVVTRGTPDMREPQGKAPIHMMQKDFSEYSHPGVINKISQDTALDKSARQITIFDNLQRRHDPDRTLREFPGEPLTYSPPGRGFARRFTEKEQPIKSTRKPSQSKEEILSKAYKGVSKDFAIGKDYAKSQLPKTKPNIPTLKKGTSSKPPEVKDEFIDVWEGELPESKVQLPPSPPKKKTPKDYRYPYNKQILEQTSKPINFKRKKQQQ